MQNNLMKAAIVLAAVATLAAACKTTEDDYQPAANTETNAVAQTFTIEFPASINGNNSISKSMTISNDDSPSCRFKASEKVYVYNKTQEEYLEGTLSPTNISSNGLSCVIAGNVTGTVEVNDELEFYYNADNFDNQEYAYRKNIKYEEQNGEKTNLLDAGIAAGITVVSVDQNGKFTLDKDLEFKMLQSMFKFKFESNNQPVTVKTLVINSEDNSIYAFYQPYYTPAYQGNGMLLYPTSPTSGYLYAAICINESLSTSSDALTFIVEDNNGVLYKGEAAAPSGGFKNGNYYYKNAAIALTQFGQLPTIGGTDSNIDKEFSGLAKHEHVEYYVEAEKWGDPCIFQLSGTSTGCFYFLSWGGTVTLNNLTATYGEFEEPFMESSGGGITLDIHGSNSIACTNNDYCFVNVRLTGNGTLTLTAKKSEYKGFYNNTYTVADGYTVTCSDATDNGDGTYSWTYTISGN
ncbi:MAG: hypothetical protein IKQ70_06210 [Bacteroidales bacterium]|nr:hypothetical protein [Bacteroidales bacterium]